MHARNHCEIGLVPVAPVLPHHLLLRVPIHLVTKLPQAKHTAPGPLDKNRIPCTADQAVTFNSTCVVALLE